MTPFGKHLSTRSRGPQTHESPSVAEKASLNWRKGGRLGDHYAAASELLKRLRGVSVHSRTQSKRGSAYTTRSVQPTLAPLLPRYRPGCRVLSSHDCSPRIPLRWPSNARPRTPL